MSSCADGPKLDKSKFSELNRAAQNLKTAVSAGTACEVPDTVVQALSSGTEALKDKTASKRELDLLWAYSDLLKMIRDGLLVCQSRAHSSDFDFVPKGRLFVTQDLDPVAERYGLPTEKHVYKPTGAHWKSIPEDSLLVIWKRAEAEIKNIETMTKYN